MRVKIFIEEFRPQKLVSSLTAGLIVGITDVSVEISLAALIFSGVLAPYVAHGIGFVLFGAFAILLPIENWMLDESHFIPDSNSSMSNTIDQEDEMQVEDWMLDESHFLTKENSDNTGSGAN